uniref:Uncharacterized protein n=1 Tax=Tanacetum cinerariifolium TaxID=118510 RepID=A0A699HFY7_TANCI|nr:hypothetical protein [Tanacetum cinerariifolium]
MDPFNGVIRAEELYRLYELNEQSLAHYNEDEAGANNDLNVLHRSNLFDDVLDDLAPKCPFTTDDELIENELKQVEVDDQAIRTFFSIFLKTSMLMLMVVKLLRKSGYAFNK